MRTLLATALLLLIPILTHATTYHTRLMASFDAPNSTSTLYLATKLNDDPVRAWLFGEGQRLDFEYTHTTDNWQGYELFRFYGVYYDDALGYQPLLPDVHVWYDDTAPVMTLRLTNYFTGYHVTSTNDAMFVPGVDGTPFEIQWETWATNDTPQPPEQPAPVPEPSTCLLMIAGIISVISVSRSSCRRCRV